ncbi:MAG: ATP-binding cassette domain-containing protein, partial [Vicinamibacterales bacterium]
MSFDLRPGEVHALVGENGAGKSTLIKIMTGAERADAGALIVDGIPVPHIDPHTTRELGIAAIYQQPALFPDLTVAENIALSLERGGSWRRIDRGGRRRRASELLERIGVTLAPDRRVGDLTMPEQQVVEIAKAIGADARIVIMDEPTAALSQHEIIELYKIIAQLKAAGKSILFISHKFEEIFAIADRWAVLRDGRYIGSGAIGEVTRDELVTMMVGRRLDQVFPKVSVPIGETVLEVEDLSHPTEFDAISFKLGRGEILGFYGLVGAGRSEVMQALFGITRPSRGRVRIAG